MSMRVRMNNESSSLYAANIPGTIPSHALPSPCKLLSVGQDFDGTHNVSISQKDEAWKVNICLQGSDLEHVYLCGSLDALNMPSTKSPVVLFWEGKIVGNRNYKAIRVLQAQGHCMRVRSDLVAIQGGKPTNLWNVSVINTMALVQTEHEISKHKSFAFDLGLEEGDNHYWLMKLEDIMTTCVLGDRFCFVETGNDMQISATGRSFESNYAATMVAQTIKQDDITSFYTGSTLPVQRAMIVTISELALYA
ncbi:hypothetical protein SUGI_1120990 [Cryptomeria japonica]|nr:hypothetical protein SUGI_1120990 [Cryptomeria japonica]